MKSYTLRPDTVTHTEFQCYSFRYHDAVNIILPYVTDGKRSHRQRMGLPRKAGAASDVGVTGVDGIGGVGVAGVGGVEVGAGGIGGKEGEGGAGRKSALGDVLGALGGSGPGGVHAPGYGGPNSIAGTSRFVYIIFSVAKYLH
jgi:hypothetical protein